MGDPKAKLEADLVAAMDAARDAALRHGVVFEGVEDRAADVIVREGSAAGPVSAWLVCDPRTPLPPTGTPEGSAFERDLMCTLVTVLQNEGWYSVSAKIGVEYPRNNRAYLSAFVTNDPLFLDDLRDKAKALMATLPQSKVHVLDISRKE